MPQNWSLAQAESWYVMQAGYLSDGNICVEWFKELYTIFCTFVFSGLSKTNSCNQWFTKQMWCTLVLIILNVLKSFLLDFFSSLTFFWHYNFRINPLYVFHPGGPSSSSYYVFFFLLLFPRCSQRNGLWLQGKVDWPWLSGCGLFFWASNGANVFVFSDTSQRTVWWTRPSVVLDLHKGKSCSNAVLFREMVHVCILVLAQWSYQP